MSTGRRKKIVSKRKAKNSGNGMAVAIGILLGLLVMGGVGWYFWGSSGSAPAGSSQDASAPVATTSPSPQPDAVAPPALANLDFGPAPPTGMVLSQAMIQDMQKMIDQAAADAKAAGVDIPAEEMKASEAFRPMRIANPEFLCVTPDVEQSLLKGAFPLDAARKEFEQAMQAMDAAGVEYPMLFVEIRDQAKAQKPITAATYLIAAQVARLKVKAEGTPPSGK